VRPATLRGRLSLVAVSVTAAWVGVLTVGFNVVLAGELHAESGRTLQDRAEAAAATVQVRRDGTLRVQEPPADEALDADVWVYEGTRALERPRAGRRVQQEADALAGRGQRFEQTNEPAASRLFALPIRSAGRQVGTVVTAVSLEPYRHARQLALVASAGLVLLLLAGVYAATRALVARALEPVQVMTQQAARWSAEDAEERFGAADRPEELAVLAENLDGVLDRQAALLRHEQQLTEELSHELRTPLAVITAEIELLQARSRTAAERDRAVGAVSAATARMSSILETLLTTARSRSSSSVGRCRVAPVLTGAVPAPAPFEVVVRCDPDLTAGVDAPVLDRILAPLVENARRYARTRISLYGDADGNVVRVRVHDDGPGVAEELREAVFQPGQRGPADEHPGAGLGLALARRLARASGGDVQATDAGFVVRLPRG
jgi:signal transduction histidine kinase